MKTTTEVPIRIRLATEIDVPFIFNSWLKSFRNESFAKNITTTVYYSEHHKVIEDLLKSCQVFIACDHNNPEDIFGYACAEFVDSVFVLHFIYVKQTYRRLGVAKSLISQYGHDFKNASIYTHNTKYGDRLAAAHNMLYSPYVALTKEYRAKKEGKDESK